MYYVHLTVVLWCDVLGAFHWRQEPLSWSGPSLPPQSSREWTQTRQAKQCCMLRGNVSKVQYSGVHIYTMHMSSLFNSVLNDSIIYEVQLSLKLLL